MLGDINITQQQQLVKTLNLIKSIGYIETITISRTDRGCA
jgi:hypothetical protein